MTIHRRMFLTVVFTLCPRLSYAGLEDGVHREGARRSALDSNGASPSVRTWAMNGRFPPSPSNSMPYPTRTRLRDTLVSTQLKDGDPNGSWSPDRPTPEKWGAAGGRHYVTCMNLLMLEVYYRHLPLYIELGK